jgi:hypothetical protein
MDISDLNWDQIIGGMVLGWFTLALLTIIINRCLQSGGGWIEPPKAWPRPRDKTTSINLDRVMKKLKEALYEPRDQTASIELDRVMKKLKEALDEYHLNSPKGGMNE